MAGADCMYCHGHGGFSDPNGRWRPCSCRRPSQAQLAAQRRLNSIGARNQQPLPLLPHTTDEERDRA